MTKEFLCFLFFFNYVKQASSHQANLLSQGYDWRFNQSKWQFSGRLFRKGAAKLGNELEVFFYKHNFSELETKDKYIFFRPSDLPFGRTHYRGLKAQQRRRFYKRILKRALKRLESKPWRRRKEFILKKGGYIKKTRIRYKWLKKFMWYYKKQFSTLALFGRKNRAHFWNYRLKSLEVSRRLWLCRKAKKRYRRWVVRKKFNIRQQVSFTKFRTYPRLQKLFESPYGQPYYLLRRVSSAFVVMKLLSRLKSISFFTSRAWAHNLLKKGILAGFLKRRSYGDFPYSSRRRYFCLFLKKVRTNYYLTLTNGLGQVFLHLSSGAYLVKVNDKKRNKKTRASFRHFSDFLRRFVVLLKQNGVRRIKYFMRPNGLKWKFSTMIVYNLLDSHITIENIMNTKLLRHSLKKKKSKKRRL